MKISKNYIILYSVIILLTSLFLIFLLVFKHNEPNIPDWILSIGYLFFAASIISCIWNLKSVQITENGIQINRTILPNIIIDKDDIVEIEENRFKYRGEHNTQTVYNGYYLTISSKKKTFSVKLYYKFLIKQPDYFISRTIS